MLTPAMAMAMDEGSAGGDLAVRGRGGRRGAGGAGVPGEAREREGGEGVVGEDEDVEDDAKEVRERLGEFL